MMGKHKPNISLENQLDTSMYNDLIKEIWAEKREKVLTSSAKKALDVASSKPVLYISLPSPNFNVQDISQGVLSAMEHAPLQDVYNWSENWGLTKVVLGENILDFKYLEKGSVETKNKPKISTNFLVKPSDRILAPNNQDYFILLNNEELSLEGLVLQTSRMVDELVWGKGLSLRGEGLDNLSAYSEALKDISGKGFDIYAFSSHEILKKRLKDKNYLVRMYGNVTKKGTVPDIIGAVGPFDSLKRESFIEKYVKDLESKKRGDKESSKDVISMGIFVAKRPHLGHMLLGGIVETAKRSAGGNLELIIDANDTGPRICKLIAVGAKTSGLSYSDFVSSINLGKISPEELQDFYQNRENVTFQENKEAEVFLKNNKVSLAPYAEKHKNIFSNFFKKQIELVSDSSISKKFLPQSEFPTNWGGTGFEYLKVNGQNIILESGGLPTAISRRYGFLNYVVNMKNIKNIAYIDGDKSIRVAKEMLNAKTSENIFQFPGTGIGFDFDISSGSKVGTVLMEDFMKEYSLKNPNKNLLEDIVYFVNNRYYLEPLKSLPFFNYKDFSSFLSDVETIQSEKNLDLIMSEKYLEKIDFLIHDSPTSFGKKRKKEKKLHYKLRQLRDYGDNLDNNYLKHLFLKEERLLENSKLQSYVAKQVNNTNEPRETAYLNSLFDILDGKLQLESTIINQLKSNGYEGNDLRDGLNKFVTEGYSFKKFNNIDCYFKKTIEELVDNSLGLYSEDASILKDLYQTSIRKLYG